MQALDFWKAVTVDKANFLEDLIAVLHNSGVRYCAIGGVAVNAYAEPVVTLDLDLVVAVDDLAGLEPRLRERFRVKRFPHRLTVTREGSGLAVQIQTDPRYLDFLARASRRDVLGPNLFVAAVEDVLQGKIWAASDPDRRTSKRLKDLADIARLLEIAPELKARIPAVG